MKAGIYTTEFWLTVFTNASSLVATYGGFIPTPWGMVIGAVVTAGYTISRGLAKQGTPTQ